MKSTLDITELAKMSAAELTRELKQKRTEAAKMRLGLTIQKEKNHAAYRLLRRDIARMCMVLGSMVTAAPVTEPKKPRKTSSQSAETSVKRMSSQPSASRLRAKKSS